MTEKTKEQIWGFIVLALFIGAGVYWYMSSNKEKTDNYAKIQYKNSIVEAAVNEYSIKYKWDTLDLDYTVDYAAILATKYQLIDNFSLADLYIKDSVMHAFIKASYYPAYYFSFPVTVEQANELREGNHLILVVSINKIQKASLSIEGDEDPDNQLGYTLSTGNDFIGSGSLIKILDLADNKHDSHEK